MRQNPISFHHFLVEDLVFLGPCGCLPLCFVYVVGAGGKVNARSLMSIGGQFGA